MRLTTVDTGERTNDGEHSQWNAYVDQSSQSIPFHRFEALSILADHADADLHLLVGWTDSEPTGVLPVFATRTGPFQMVRSPPTQLEVPYLGPALFNVDGLPHHERERRNDRFIDACFDWIGDELGPDHLDLRTTDRYGDVRPLLRNDCEVRPSYTYVLDLTPDLDELLTSFSRSARKNITSEPEIGYTIAEGGPAEIERTIELVRNRHAEQDIELGLDADLVIELYRTLPDGCIRPYACYADDEFLGGMLTLEDDNRIYSWQCGTRFDVPLPVAVLLDWHVIREGRSRGRENYDLVGGMKPSICKYKSQFNPDIVALYVAQRKLPELLFASKAYEWVPQTLRSHLPLP